MGLGQFDPYILTLEEEANRAGTGEMLCIFKQLGQGRTGPSCHHIEARFGCLLDPFAADRDGEFQPFGRGAQEIRLFSRRLVERDGQPVIQQKGQNQARKPCSTAEIGQRFRLLRD